MPLINLILFEDQESSASTLRLTTQFRSCASGSTNTPPRFPGLYVPHDLDQDGLYLCSTYDAWLFTTLWTLIVYAAFYLAAAGYAFLVQVGASASGRGRIRLPETAGSAPPGSRERSSLSGSASGTIVRTEKGAGGAQPVSVPGERGVEGLVQGARRNWKVTIAVGVAYVVVGGAEAVLAGGIVGAILGTVYDAGGFRLSTWVPLVWAVINVLFLLLSSFSIQERLL